MTLRPPSISAALRRAPRACHQPIQNQANRHGITTWATWALCIREGKSARFRERAMLPIVPIPRKPLGTDHEPRAAFWERSSHATQGAANRVWTPIGLQTDSRERLGRKEGL